MTRRWHWIALFTGALAIRLWQLDAQSLWFDEGSTWAEVTGKDWPQLFAELFSPNAGYPLYHLILKVWVAVAGDGVWALRFPSALAGAAACLAVAWAGGKNFVGAHRDAPVHHSLPAAHASPAAAHASPAAGILAAISPFALWHAQDAKAYSLLFLASALLVGTTLRAAQHGTRRAWLWVVVAAVFAVLVHRLALFGVAATCVVAAAGRREDPVGAYRDVPRHNPRRPARPPVHRALRRAAAIAPAIAALTIAAVGVVGVIAAARGEALGGARVAAGPFTSLGLSLSRFALDRAPGDIDGYAGLPWWLWLAPAALATLLGLAGTAARHNVWAHRDAPLRDPAAAPPDPAPPPAMPPLSASERGLGGEVIMFLIPLVLLAITAALAPVFEPRYAMVAFPAWLILICRPLDGRWRPAAGVVLAGVAIAGVGALTQPGYGLLSRGPVKENWRAAIQLLANRAHPDDLIIVHPYYVKPLYDYYAPRLTRDPLPPAVTFPIFAEGDTGGIARADDAELREFVGRTYDPFFNAAAKGKTRALLLIAPDHAAEVDPPLPGDTYGLVGLRFQYASENGAWGCGDDRFVGVALHCIAFPDVFAQGQTSTPPQPQTPIDAVFGGELRLRGISIAPFDGQLRPGGTLPVTLFWQAETPPRADYRVFLHLCQDCSQPPVANDDGAPLRDVPPAGRTSTWIAGDPVHDERTLVLPPDLPPGRYTLLLGVYAGDGSPATRLAVAAPGDNLLPDARLILATVEIP